MTVVLTLSNVAEPEAAAVINAGLDGFNDAAVGYADREPLNVVARDAAGRVLGGILASTSLGLVFVNLVYLPDALRGASTGRRMMAMVEAEARRRGCVGGVLFTISFQAPGFYQKLGWRVFGEVPCLPAGTSRVFLRKEFSPAGRPPGS